jgi:hypothetical protein
MRKLLILLALLMFAGCSSSSEDEKNGEPNSGNCVETLPDCDTSVCVGNYVRSCSEDGKHYEYELCFNQTCKDGVCAGPACLEPGKTECKTGTEYDLCLPNMTMVTTKECPEGTKCASGACVAETCTAGDTSCGWQSILTCEDDGSWSKVECAAGEYCDASATVCVPVDPFCASNPLGAYCDGLEYSMQCDELGKVGQVKCSKNDICVGSFCQPEACGITYQGTSGPDATSGSDSTTLVDIVDNEIEELVTIDLGDPPEAPPLEKTPKAVITLNGGEFEMWEVKFTSAKQANYVFKDQDLQISMAKGQFLMEIHFMGIEEGVVGSFSSEEPGSVNVLMLFNDGTTDQEVVQWKWSSVSFNATLDQFEGPGGWVKGTFSGTLEQAQETGGGPPVDILNGFFEVPRKE